MLTLTLLALAWAPQASAKSSYPALIPSGVSDSNGKRCWNCHVNAGGGGTLTTFGTAFALGPDGASLSGDDHAWTSWLASQDSDGDGWSNGQELGDPFFLWATGDGPSAGGYLGNPGRNGSQTTNCSNLFSTKADCEATDSVPDDFDLCAVPAFNDCADSAACLNLGLNDDRGAYSCSCGAGGSPNVWVASADGVVDPPYDLYATATTTGCDPSPPEPEPEPELEPQPEPEPQPEAVAEPLPDVAASDGDGAGSTPDAPEPGPDVPPEDTLGTEDVTVDAQKLPDAEDGVSDIPDAVPAQQDAESATPDASSPETSAPDSAVPVPDPTPTAIYSLSGGQRGCSGGGPAGPGMPLTLALAALVLALLRLDDLLGLR